MAVVKNVHAYAFHDDHMLLEMQKLFSRKLGPYITIMPNSYYTDILPKS
jgi:hypothetical protein